MFTEFVYSKICDRRTNNEPMKGEKRHCSSKRTLNTGAVGNCNFPTKSEIEFSPVHESKYRWDTRDCTQQCSTTYATVILYTILILLPSGFCLGTIAPTIDYSHNMRILKLPRSTQPGSLIYRLKGSDGDPNSQLSFGVAGIEGRALLDVVPVARSWNEADVYLRRELDEPKYNLTIYVTDGNTTTQVESTILVTNDQAQQTADSFEEQQLAANNSSNFSAPSSPFINTKHVFHVPEDTAPDEPVGYVTALESQKSDLPVRFELRGRGSDKFSIKYVFGPKGQSKAEIVLAQRVDYEKQNVFTLKVLALNAWTNTRFDTRNVATMDIVITLGDVQDTAPIFRNLPRSLRLSNLLKAGDLVLKVEAEDGDYADQRPVSYALDAASPLAGYFDIDKQSGEIRLTKPTSELAMHAAWDSAAWSTLTIFASEVPDTTSYEHLWPPMYARAELPLILVDVKNEPPKFVGGWQTSSSDPRDPIKTLHGYLAEPVAAGQATGSSLSADLFAGLPVRWYTNSSETGSSLADNLSKSMNGRPSVLDLGLGSNGTFELLLEGPDAALFQLEPAFPVSKQSAFTLSIASNIANRSIFDRDYGQQQQHLAASGSIGDTHSMRIFNMDIIARDFGTPERQSSRIRCLIELLDANDNAPQFDSDLYSFSVYENSLIGQLVGTVQARDFDSGLGGRIRYTALTGLDNNLFRLEPESGQIKLAGNLDREKRNLYLFLVEARDLNGIGSTNYTQVIINVLDVNDNAPVFVQNHYDAVLLADGSFHQVLQVNALDADEPGTANSQVAYEIIAGNQNEQFSIDSVSGIIYPIGSGDPNKTPNVLPQIPPILSEPIKPFVRPSLSGETSQTNSATPAAGKIMPSHEVEDTTVRSSARRDRPVTLDINGDVHTVQFNDTSLLHAWPRSVGSETGEEGDKQSATSATAATIKPNQIGGHSISDHVSGGQEFRNLGRSLAALPQMDADQLPALDLLLNLESETRGFISSEHQNNARSSGFYSEQHNSPQANLNAMQVPPLTTLIVRAHDYGIPLRSSTTKVNIYNQALLSRSLSVILNGTAEQLEQRRDAIERAFSAMTGSKATIESIDALSESSSISVARVRLSVPQHSLVDLTDLTALMNAIDYRPQASRHSQEQTDSIGKHPTQTGGITHYVIGDPRQLTPSMSSNFTSGGFFGDINSYALDGSGVYGLERRLLVYIIIVAVCILALLLIWMIYSCSREDQQRVKVIEKANSVVVGASNGQYRQTNIANEQNLGTNNQATTASSKTTHAKTAIDAETTTSSPIGNNLAKTQQRPSGQMATLPNSSVLEQRMLEMDGQRNSSRDMLLLPTMTTIKPDHFSMYNGQVWFEPTANGNALAFGPKSQFRGSEFASGQNRMSPSVGRRASSAPSATSLDSALRSAINGGLQTGHPGAWRLQQQQHALGRNSGTPRNATGQFFPNTIGYMQNLASLGGSIGSNLKSSEIYGRNQNVKRHRRHRVAPMELVSSAFNAPSKPPRFSMRDVGHSNEAFENDLESGGGLQTSVATSDSRRPSNRATQRRKERESEPLDDADDIGSLASGSSRSGSAASSGGRTVVLDSDQELLGFDSSGTPIIATHTSIKPLVVDMLEPVGVAAVSSTNGAKRAAPAHKRPLLTKPGESQVEVSASPKQSRTTIVSSEVSPASELAPAGGGRESPKLAVTSNERNLQLGGASEEPTPVNPANGAQQTHSVAGGNVNADCRLKLDENDQREEVADVNSPNRSTKGVVRAKTLTKMRAQESLPLLPPPAAARSPAQGDLMSELNEKLTKRQQSVDSDGSDKKGADFPSSENGIAADKSQATATTGSSPAKKATKQQSLASDSSSSTSSSACGQEVVEQFSREMRNGELLEKQSIFGLTYSGLATGKPPA